MENEVNQVSVIYDDSMIELAERAEKRVQAINKIKQMALKATNEHDWCDQSGRPYLEGFGCEKVAGLFGIGWRDIKEPMMFVEEDGHFMYSYTGTFVMGGREIEVIGTRSSRDEFFSKRYKFNEETGKKEAYSRPPSEIDKGDVKKAAYTNLLMNGITRILGIRNLTYDDLKAAGLDVSKITKVEYGKQEMSGEAQDKRKELETMLKEMGGGDPAVASRLLAEYTTFTGTNGKQVPGKTKIEDLSEKAIPVTYQKVKKMYDAWKKGQNGQSSDTATDLGGKEKENKG
jgi:hypothetical protein